MLLVSFKCQQCICEEESDGCVICIDDKNFQNLLMNDRYILLPYHIFISRHLLENSVF